MTIATLISRLLAHYWAANEDTRLRAAIADDWLGDLREFDADIVDAACTEWRRMQDRRPTISNIRKLCREYQEIRAPKKPKMTPQQLAEAQAAARRYADQENARYAAAFDWRQRFAESRGFPNFTAVIEFGMVKALGLPPLPGYADPLLELRQ